MGKPEIPEQFANATIETIPQKSLRNCVLRYGQHFWEAASKGLGPLLLGDPATYKSFAAATLSKALHERARIHVAWCEVPITLNQLERKRFDKSTDERIEEWKQAPWLVMDDFAMAKMESWQYGVLVEIAMSRFDTGRPTCWTGNIEVQGTATPQLVEDALKRAVGVQVTRRILERSEGYRVYTRAEL